MSDWHPNTPDHRDPANDDAVLRHLLTNQHRHHPHHDPLESAQLTYALWAALGFVSGMVFGIVIASVVLGGYQ